MNVALSYEPWDQYLAALNAGGGATSTPTTKNPGQSVFASGTPSNIGAMVPHQEAVSSYNPSTKSTMVYQQTKGGASMSDYVNQALADRQQAMAAAQITADRQAQGLTGMETAVGNATSGTRTRAKESKERMDPMVMDAMNQGIADVQKTRAFVEGLVPKAEARRAEALQATEALRQESLSAVAANKAAGLGEFDDKTANTIQLQRQSIMSSRNTQREEIMAAARQNGLDVNSPEVQDQLRQLDMDTSGTIGNMASQIAVTHNQTRAQLRQSYDQLDANLRSTEDQLAASVRTEEDKYVGLTESSVSQQMLAADSLTANIRNAALGELASLEQSYAQSMLAADQMELQGASAIADYLRNMDTFLFPLADLVGDLADMTSSLNTAAQQSAMGMNMQLGIRTPSSTALNPLSSMSASTSAGKDIYGRALRSTQPTIKAGSVGGQVGQFDQFNPFSYSQGKTGLKANPGTVDATGNLGSYISANPFAQMPSSYSGTTAWSW